MDLSPRVILYRVQKPTNPSPEIVNVKIESFVALALLQAQSSCVCPRKALAKQTNSSATAKKHVRKCTTIIKKFDKKAAQKHSVDDSATSQEQLHSSGTSCEKVAATPKIRPKKSILAKSKIRNAEAPPQPRNSPDSVISNTSISTWTKDISTESSIPSDSSTSVTVTSNDCVCFNSKLEQSKNPDQLEVQNDNKQLSLSEISSTSNMPELNQSTSSITPESLLSDEMAYESCEEFDQLLENFNKVMSITDAVEECPLIPNYVRSVDPIYDKIVDAYLNSDSDLVAMMQKQNCEKSVEHHRTAECKVHNESSFRTFSSYNYNLSVDRTNDDEGAMSLNPESISDMETSNLDSAASVSNVRLHHVYIIEYNPTACSIQHARRMRDRPTKIKVQESKPAKESIENAEINSISSDQDNDRDTTPKEISRACVPSSGSKDMNIPAKSDRLFSSYESQNQKKSVLYGHVCSFYLANTCKIINCNLAHHVTIDPNLFKFALQTLTEDKLIEEYLLMCKYEKLRNTCIFFVEECERRAATRILFEMAIGLGLGIVEIDEDLRVKVMETVLLHLNSISLDACEDLLQFEVNGRMMCDDLLVCMANSQNFGQLKPAFRKLAQLIFELPRPVDIHVVSCLLERVCILPVVEENLGWGMLTLMKITEVGIFKSSLANKFEIWLSATDGDLYKLYLMVKNAALKRSTRLLKPPDFSNMDGLHEQLSLLFSTEESLEDAEIISISTDQDNDRDTTPKEICRASVPSSGAKDMNIPAKSDLVFSSYEAQNLIKSVLYSDVCSFYLESTCKIISCNLAHHVTIDPNLFKFALKTLTEDKLIEEYLLMCKYEKLRNTCIFFVEECERRAATRILFEMAIALGLGIVEIDEDLRVKVLETVLLHLNTISLDACEDFLEIKVNGRMMCDHLLVCMANSQNFVQLKPAFRKLAELIFALKRPVDIHVASCLLERVCILPVVEENLGWGMLTLMKNTEVGIFKSSLAHKFAFRLSATDGDLYKLYQIAKEAALRSSSPLLKPRGSQIEPLRPTPDFSNMDGLHEQLSFLCSTEESIEDAEIISIFSDKDNDRDTTPKEICRACVSSRFTDMNIPAKSDLVFSSYEAQNLMKSVLYSDVCSFYLESTCKIINCNLAHHVTIDPNLFKFALQTLTEDKLIEEYLLMCKYEKLRNTCIFFVEECERRAATRILFEMAIALGLGIVEIDEDLRVKVMETVLLHLNTISLDACEDFLEIKVNGRMMCDDLLVCMANSQNFVQLKPAFRKLAELIFALKRPVDFHVASCLLERVCILPVVEENLGWGMLTLMKNTEVGIFKSSLAHKFAFRLSATDGDLHKLYLMAKKAALRSSTPLLKPRGAQIKPSDFSNMDGLHEQLSFLCSTEESLEDAEIISISTDQDNDRDTTPKEICRASVPSSGSTDMNLPAKSDLVFSSYEAQNVIKSVLYSDVCSFYLESTCKIINCHLAHHVVIYPNLFKFALQTLTEDKLIEEYLLMCKYEKLRYTCIFFVEECERRAATRILFEMAIALGLGIVEIDEDLRVKVLETVLLHLNTISLDACEDFLEIKVNGRMMCDDLLVCMANSQNFVQLKPAFKKLAELIFALKRPVDIHVVSCLLERVCILPVVEENLGWGMLTLMKNTEVDIFKSSLAHKFEIRLSATDGDLYKLYQIAKEDALRSSTPLLKPRGAQIEPLRPTPDFSNMDGLHEQLSFLCSTEESIEDAEIISIFSDKDNDRDTTPKEICRACVPSSGAKDMNIPAKSALVFSLYEAQNLIKSVLYSDVCSLYLESTCKIINCNLAHHVTIDPNLFKFALQTLTEDKLIEEYLLMCKYEKLRYTCIFFVEECERRAATRILFEMAIALGLGIVEIDEDLRVNVMETVLLHLNTISLDACEDFLEIKVNGRMMCDDLLVCMANSQNFVQLKPAFGKLAELIFDLKRPVDINVASCLLEHLFILPVVEQKLAWDMYSLMKNTEVGIFKSSLAQKFAFRLSAIDGDLHKLYLLDTEAALRSSSPLLKPRGAQIEPLRPTPDFSNMDGLQEPLPFLFSAPRDFDTGPPQWNRGRYGIRGGSRRGRINPRKPGRLSIVKIRNGP